MRKWKLMHIKLDGIENRTGAYETGVRKCFWRTMPIFNLIFYFYLWNMYNKNFYYIASSHDYGSFLTIYVECQVSLQKGQISSCVEIIQRVSKSRIFIKKCAVPYSMYVCIYLSECIWFPIIIVVMHTYFQ